MRSGQNHVLGFMSAFEELVVSEALFFPSEARLRSYRDCVYC